jgi:tryptophan synthase alpha chain
VQSRIDNCFAELRARHRRGFIPYICAGDPTLEKTVDLVGALENSGADLVELGIPFSDPLADGLVNQLAAQRALAGGATVRGVLECVREIRRRSQIPIVLYTYLNPIFRIGLDRFHRDAASAGVDGLLILDLPPEEEPFLGLASLRAAGSNELEASQWTIGSRLRAGASACQGDADATGPVHIRLIAPTTPLERIARVASGAQGFLYYVSREGVTGEQDAVASSLAEKIAALRKLSALPIAVGFGISNADQAREVARCADAVVVGSAIVDLIAKHGNDPELLEKVGAFVRELAGAIKSV